MDFEIAARKIAATHPVLVLRKWWALFTKYFTQDDSFLHEGVC
jgi:hypothetical protein